MKTMIVAGVMSGTSADGVDVALVRVTASADGVPKLKVLGHEGFAYPKAVRAAVLRVMEGGATNAAEMSRLSWRLGEVYAECVERACATAGVTKLALVGMHGQTVYHQATAERYAGAAVRCTLQIGEAAVVRERLGVPVVSDFRPADMAAGGQGAPLVPMLDYCMFRSRTKSRVLLNLGGIANVTAIPAGAGLDGLMAFDTGPANMVVDALMQAEFGKPFDRGGKVAAGGRVLGHVIAQVLRDPYFAMLPPKSCGREEFGAAFVERFRGLCEGTTAADMIATATELTAVSILDAYGRFCWAHLGQRAPLAKATEMIAAGGGTRNATLMRRLREGFAHLGVKVLAMDELGLKAEAKEAAAFALLAWLSWNAMPGNVPSATGAKRAVVLGKISW
jgi:anhydro-N-acetylmuramic acid kinase